MVLVDSEIIVALAAAQAGMALLLRRSRHCIGMLERVTLADSLDERSMFAGVLARVAPGARFRQ